MNGLIMKAMTTSLWASLLLNNLPTVYASQQGDLESAITTFSPVLDKLKAPLSMLLNLTAFGFAIFCAVKGVIALIQALNEENPNEAKSKKEAAIKSFIATGISIVAVVLINAILAVFGVGFTFVN